jgi:hypothetical protein
MVPLQLLATDILNVTNRYLLLLKVSSYTAELLHFISGGRCYVAAVKNEG